jgi:hypothetical protein
MTTLQRERALLHQNKKVELINALDALDRKVEGLQFQIEKLGKTRTNIVADLERAVLLCEEYEILSAKQQPAPTKKRKIKKIAMDNVRIKKVKRVRRQQISGETWAKIFSILPKNVDDAVPKRYIFDQLESLGIDATDQALYMQLVRFESKGLTARIKDDGRDLWYIPTDPDSKEGETAIH